MKIPARVIIDKMELSFLMKELSMKPKKIGLAAWTLAFAAAVICLVSPAAAQRYKRINLVSDIPGKAAHTDSHLVNSWGIVRSSTGPFWIADNGTGVST